MIKKILGSIIVGLLVISFATSSLAGLDGVEDTDSDGLNQAIESANGAAIKGGVGSTIPLMTHDLDLSYCGSRGVQCSLSGHTFEPVSSTNHNPVRIGILVTVNGVGVPGLQASDFTFSNPFVPAGGPGAVICGTTDCGASSFQDGGNGQYTIFIHPGSATNWKAGHYFGSLSVKKSLSSLVSWEVP